jgi:hypothetical protein
LLEGIRHRIRKDRDANRGVVVAALDAHILRLIVAQGAGSVARTL